MPKPAPTDTPAGTAPVQPVGTPPGGGEWTWDADAGAWVRPTPSTPE